MRERRAFRRTGGAARELDIDRIVRLQGRADVAQTIPLGRAAQLRYRLKVVGARRRLIAEPDDGRQLRQARGAQLPGRALRKFRREIMEHAEIFGRLEPLSRHQRLAAHLVERVFQFRQAIRGIDAHENRADFRGRVLGDHPLRAVRRPDAYAVPNIDAQREQSAGERIHARAKLGPGPAHVLKRHDERFTRAVSRHGGIERAADCVEQQRRGGGGTYIAAGQVGHVGGLRSAGGIEQFTADEHAADFAGAGADFVQLRIAQQAPGRVVVQVAVAA